MELHLHSMAFLPFPSHCTSQTTPKVAQEDSGTLQNSVAAITGDERGRKEFAKAPPFVHFLFWRGTEVTI